MCNNWGIFGQLAGQLAEMKNAFSRQSLSNFFTIARFGPDTLVIFTLLTGISLALYYWGMWYLSAAVILTLIILFMIESTETISLSRAEYRQILGSKCLVIQSATPGSRGIVRLYSSAGCLDGELWSTDYSQSPIRAGKIATVTGINSTILQIGPNN